MQVPIKIWAINDKLETIRTFKSFYRADEWLIKNKPFQILWQGTGAIHVYYS
jgi:hypothetical protein